MFLMHRLQERSAKDRFRHDATSWMHLVHRLASRTRGPASGCPVIIMVQSSHDRTSNYLLACILRGRNRPEPFRYLLRNPLMWACLVEVPHIRIQNALELLLLQNQQVVQAFLSHTPQEALADRIGAWRMIRRFQYLDAAGCGHARETGSELGITITDEILRPSSISSRLP